jgi:hypothetical protein
MKNRLVSECYLEAKYGIKHDNIPELYLKQYYMVGKLFPHKKICSYCLIKLQDASKQVVGMGDDYTLMEIWKRRNPEYVRVAEEIGVDFLRTELARNIFELPYEPRTTETDLPVEWGEVGKRVGNPPETPKKPIVIVD